MQDNIRQEKEKKMQDAAGSNYRRNTALESVERQIWDARRGQTCFKRHVLLSEEQRMFLHVLLSGKKINEQPSKSLKKNKKIA